jgi:hypothetical protein
VEQSEHPTWREILDAVESPTGPSSGFETHLDRCSSCRAEREAAVRLLGLLERARLAQVPESLMERTLARLHEETGDTVTGPSSAWELLLAELRAGLQELSGQLVADSLTPSPAVRGAEPSGPRTLLYETESYSVSLALGRGDAGTAGVSLRGQVIPRIGDCLPAGSRAILHRADQVTETRLDDLGEFSFSTATVKDPLWLVIVLGSRFVHLGPLAAMSSRPGGGTRGV